MLLLLSHSAHLEEDMTVTDLGEVSGTPDVAAQLAQMGVQKEPSVETAAAVVDHEDNKSPFETIPFFKYAHDTHEEKDFTEAQCTEACHADEKCLSFSYAKTSKMCLLSTSCVQYDLDFDFFAKGGAGDFQSLGTLKYMYVAGESTVTPLQGVKKEVCEQKCESLTTCQSYTYRARDELCLYSAQQMGYDNDFVYYEKSGVAAEQVKEDMWGKDPLLPEEKALADMKERSAKQIEVMKGPAEEHPATEDHDDVDHSQISPEQKLYLEGIDHDRHHDTQQAIVKRALVKKAREFTDEQKAKVAEAKIKAERIKYHETFNKNQEINGKRIAEDSFAETTQAMKEAEETEYKAGWNKADERLAKQGEAEEEAAKAKVEAANQKREEKTAKALVLFGQELLQEQDKVKQMEESIRLNGVDLTKEKSMAEPTMKKLKSSKEDQLRALHDMVAASDEEKKEKIKAQIQEQNLVMITATEALRPKLVQQAALQLEVTNLVSKGPSALLTQKQEELAVVSAAITSLKGQQQKAKPTLDQLAVTLKALVDRSEKAMAEAKVRLGAARFQANQLIQEEVRIKANVVKLQEDGFVHNEALEKAQEKVELIQSEIEEFQDNQGEEKVEAEIATAKAETFKDNQALSKKENEIQVATQAEKDAAEKQEAAERQQATDVPLDEKKKTDDEVAQEMKITKEIAEAKSAQTLAKATIDKLEPVVAQLKEEARQARAHLAHLIEEGKDDNDRAAEAAEVVQKDEEHAKDDKVESIVTLAQKDVQIEEAAHAETVADRKTDIVMTPVPTPAPSPAPTTAPTTAPTAVTPAAAPAEVHDHDDDHELEEKLSEKNAEIKHLQDELKIRDEENKNEENKKTQQVDLNSLKNTDGTMNDSKLAHAIEVAEEKEKSTKAAIKLKAAAVKHIQDQIAVSQQEQSEKVQIEKENKMNQMALQAKAADLEYQRQKELLGDNCTKFTETLAVEQCHKANSAELAKRANAEKNNADAAEKAVKREQTLEKDGKQKLVDAELAQKAAVKEKDDKEAMQKQEVKTKADMAVKEKEQKAADAMTAKKKEDDAALERVKKELDVKSAANKEATSKQEEKTAAVVNQEKNEKELTTKTSIRERDEKTKTMEVGVKTRENTDKENARSITAEKAVKEAEVGGKETQQKSTTKAEMDSKSEVKAKQEAAEKATAKAESDQKAQAIASVEVANKAESKVKSEEETSQKKAAADAGKLRAANEANMAEAQSKISVLRTPAPTPMTQTQGSARV